MTKGEQPLAVGGPGHPAPERISAFLSADLAARDAAAVRSHLQECPACSAVAGELRQQTEALCRLDRPEPALTTWAAIVSACEEEPVRRGRFGVPVWSWRSLAFGMGLGAVMVSALLVALGVGHVRVAPTPLPTAVAEPPRVPERSRGLAGGAEAAAPAVATGLGADPTLEPLLREAGSAFGGAALTYQGAATRLRTLLERQQRGWEVRERARVAERLAQLDEDVAHSRTIASRDPSDGVGAEMLFAAYQRQIDYLAEVVHRGGSSGPAAEGTR